VDCFEKKVTLGLATCAKTTSTTRLSFCPSSALRQQLPRFEDKQKSYASFRIYSVRVPWQN
jgi:hypothetical protein